MYNTWPQKEARQPEEHFWIKFVKKSENGAATGGGKATTGAFKFELKNELKKKQPQDEAQPEEYLRSKLNKYNKKRPHVYIYIYIYILASGGGRR